MLTRLTLRFHLMSVLVSRLGNIYILLFLNNQGLARLGTNFYLREAQTRPEKLCPYLVCLSKFLLEGFSRHIYVK